MEHSIFVVDYDQFSELTTEVIFATPSSPNWARNYRYVIHGYLYREFRYKLFRLKATFVNVQSLKSKQLTNVL